MKSSVVRRLSACLVGLLAVCTVPLAARAQATAPVAEQANVPEITPPAAMPATGANEADVQLAPELSSYTNTPVLADDFRLGTSRRRIRLGLDEKDSLTRTETWITAVEYGLLTGEALFSAAANLDNRVAIPLYSVTLAGALTGAYFLTQRAPNLHGGVLAALNLGIWAGAMDGALIGSLITSKRYATMNRQRVASGVSWGIATLAGAGGAVLAHKLGATTGDIGLMATTTFFGASTGALIKVASFGNQNNAASNRKLSGAVLVGSLAGTGIGAAIVSKLDISRTRAFFLDLGGITGLGIGAALSQSSAKTRDSARSIAGFLLGGQLLGLATAAGLTHNLDAKLALPKDMHLQPTALPVESRNGTGLVMVPGVALALAF